MRYYWFQVIWFFRRCRNNLFYKMGYVPEGVADMFEESWRSALTERDMAVNVLLRHQKRMRELFDLPEEK